MKYRKTKDIEIEVRKTLDSDFFGAYNSHFIGNGLEFSDLRYYVPGDSIKRIDWKTTARNNEVFVKNFEQERDLHILFFLDLSSNMQFGSKNKTKIDTLFELFYTLGFAAISAGDSIGAYIFNGQNHMFFDFCKGEESLQKIASACNNVQFLKESSKSGNHFSNHLKNLEKLKIKNSLICICSDSIDFDTKILRGVNARNEILYCNIFDSFENNLWEEKVFFSFIENNTNIVQNFLNDTKRRKYRDLRKTKIEGLSRQLRSSHIEHLIFDDETHIYIKFLKYFKQANTGRS